MSKKFFIYLFIMLFLRLNSAQSQQIGWSFDDIVRLKGKEYYSTPNSGSYNINYEIKNPVIDGKEYQVGKSEHYFFDSATNKCFRYFFMGLKSESDVVEIIERNNSKLKKVDMGSKQTFYQWINIENNIEYNLRIYYQYADNVQWITYAASKKE